MNRYAVYAYEAYFDKRPGMCIGVGFTQDGARQIIRDYRRLAESKIPGEQLKYDIVTERVSSQEKTADDQT